MDPYKIILKRLYDAEATLRRLATGELNRRLIVDAANDIGLARGSLERPDPAHAADLASSIMARAIARGVGIDPDHPTDRLSTEPFIAKRIYR